jgi:hypothetical protein
MQYGVQTKFKARLRKKKADGTIVYHDNRFLNFIYKTLDTNKRKREGGKHG